jgi:hypothetical protein
LPDKIVLKSSIWKTMGQGLSSVSQIGKEGGKINEKPCGMPKAVLTPKHRPVNKYKKNPVSNEIQGFSCVPGMGNS